MSSNVIEYLNVRSETKTPRFIVGRLHKKLWMLWENLHDIGLDSDFLHMTPKPQETTPKLNKRDYVKPTSSAQ